MNEKTGKMGILKMVGVALTIFGILVLLLDMRNANSRLENKISSLANDFSGLEVRVKNLERDAIYPVKQPNRISRGGMSAGGGGGDPTQSGDD